MTNGNAQQRPPDVDNVLVRIEREARAVALAFGVQTPNALAAALLDRLRVSIGGERERDPAE
jgi:hypothetical protein